ncbi:uncharacterized protein [Haliotis cracherodii]|uniref:uncharacterized protein n=1 Tax=Haliotis cracherodii TaxID=6455 RepID=UPI0039E79155
MTSMTKDQAKDLIPRAGAPPGQVPVMRRSRSLSELPGSVRVPIIRRTDNERMRARLEASAQGLEELKLLREQQQKQMEEVRTTALQRKPSSSSSTSSQNGRFSQSQPQLNQRRMSAASLRLSSTCLARINEEGDDGGGGGFTNGKLQDCTNLGGSTVGHRRHSSFSLEACRNRRPLNTTDTDVFEHELSTESDRLRKAQSWGSLLSGSAFRSVSSESLNERNNDISANQLSNIPNTRKNQRSSSFSATSWESYNQHFARQNPISEDPMVNNENIEPKLRRASIQCEAVLTGGCNKKNQGIFKDVDLANVSQDMPSPLHAVLHGFKASQPQNKTNKAEKQVQNGVQNEATHLGLQSVKISNSSNVIQRRNSFNIETSPSPRGNGHYYNGHSRTLSEADIHVSRLSKGYSVPNNIHDLSRDAPKVNNYFAKRSPGSSISLQNMKNEKHHVSEMSERRHGQRTYSDGNLTLDPRYKTFQNVRRVEPRTYTNNQRQQNGIKSDRKKSDDNVFVDDRMSPSRSSSTNGKTINKDSMVAETKSKVNPTESVKNKDDDKEQGKKEEQKKGDQSCANTPRSDTEHEQHQTPSLQIPYHEKKFSIASDEGYVTSPPSTPCGRHAHSIVSDSSWISTDFDDTASSCEPSPVHGPVKVIPAFLKRNDISYDYSKAKHSRRSSGYESTSECDRVQEKECDTQKREEGAKQELFKTDSCASLPFRQTEV